MSELSMDEYRAKMAEGTLTEGDINSIEVCAQTYLEQIRAEGGAVVLLRLLDNDGVEWIGSAACGPLIRADESDPVPGSLLDKGRGFKLQSFSVVEP